MENIYHKISELAELALLLEVYTTEKPGLVDWKNNGAHLDMNVELFEQSAHTLAPFFHDFIAAGAENATKSKEELLFFIRSIGIEAECAMFEVTGGVNTHKGMIFSMGILCAAIGYQHANGRFFEEKEIWELVSAMGQSAVEADLLSKKPQSEAAMMDTSGVIQFKKYGTKGVRGEAANGMPSVRQIALPEFEKQKQINSFATAGAKTLFRLIGYVEDSNVITRSNRASGQFLRKSICEYLQQGGTITRYLLQETDKLFIRWNISPGGCADLLAVTYFFYFMKHWNETQTGELQKEKLLRQFRQEERKESMDLEEGETSKVDEWIQLLEQGLCQRMSEAKEATE